MASKCTKCGSEDNYNYQLNIGLCNICIGEKLEELEAETQEVANQLMDLYDKCVDTTEPEVFGTVLGLHESLEQALKGNSNE